MAQSRQTHPKNRRDLMRARHRAKVRVCAAPLIAWISATAARLPAFLVVVSTACHRQRSIFAAARHEEFVVDQGKGQRPSGWCPTAFAMPYFFRLPPVAARDRALTSSNMRLRTFGSTI